MWATRSRPPMPFLHAVELSGGDPARWVHVGDNIETDVWVPRRIGLQAVWINRNGAVCPRTSSPTPSCRRWTGWRRWWSGCSRQADGVAGRARSGRRLSSDVRPRRPRRLDQLPRPPVCAQQQASALPERALERATAGAAARSLRPRTGSRGRSGQTPQRGRRAMHTWLPRSNSAWFQSYARPGGRRRVRLAEGPVEHPPGVGVAARRPGRRTRSRRPRRRCTARRRAAPAAPSGARGKPPRSTTRRRARCRLTARRL